MTSQDRQADEADAPEPAAPHARDWRDVIAGSALVLFGVSAAFHVVTSYPLGHPAALERGFVPAVAAMFIAAFGAGIAVPALFRPGTLPAPEWGPLAAVLAAVSVFAVLIDMAGLIPAILGLTLTAGLADKRLTLVKSLLLGAALCAIAVGVFGFALGLPLTLAKWPGA